MPHQSTRSVGYLWNSNIFPFTLMVTLALQGCATMQIPDYPASTASSYSNATTKNGLSIAVHPITQKEDLEKYFGTDLNALNILPVYIVAENGSTTSSFLISKDHVFLQNRGSHESLTEGAQTEESSGGKAAMVVAVVAAGGGLVVIPVLLLAPGFLLLGGKLISNAEVIRLNLVSKQLQTRTVSPGKSVDGFVYFKLPDEGGSLEDWYVSIQTTELGSNTSHQFTLQLNERER